MAKHNRHMNTLQERDSSVTTLEPGPESRVEAQETPELKSPSNAICPNCKSDKVRLVNPMNRLVNDGIISRWYAVQCADCMLVRWDRTDEKVDMNLVGKVAQLREEIAATRQELANLGAPGEDDLIAGELEEQQAVRFEQNRKHRERIAPVQDRIIELQNQLTGIVSMVE